MTRDPFQYALLRVVPLVERGEFVNAGVIVLCRPRRFLLARVLVDEPLLHVLGPHLDVALVRAHLEAVPRIAAGEQAAGPIAALDQAQRVHWLVAPSSTVGQASAVHTGLCEDPAVVVDRLFDRLVTRATL